jgi:2,3-bisphosphoglycerate-independent phosphoglycerate mutase
MSSGTGPTALIILDGFGFSIAKKYNAIYQAHPVTLTSWYKNYPHTLLAASGEAVGLLPGMIGNSEVGHLTLGAGRVIKQPIAILMDMIRDGSFSHLPILQTLFHYLSVHPNARLHLIGLLSDAGVHSHATLLYALLKAAVDQKVHTIILHLFLDGRDVPPRSADHYLTELEECIKKLPHSSHIIIGSLHGRFYAMDRDKNWERTQKSFFVITGKAPCQKISWQTWLATAYHAHITDEFMPPACLDEQAPIKENDALIFFNVRPERMEQLVNMINRDGPKTSFCITATPYGEQVSTALYERKPVSPTLLDCITNAGLTLFTIAESEKYAHVTYYINGERTPSRPQEKRVSIPSLHLASYEEQPCMSARQITTAVINSLITDPRNFYLINYANADMVGHSGNLEATIRAIQCLDNELADLYQAFVVERNGTLFVTADHGNAEEKWDAVHQQPQTAHTTHPVPFFVINRSLKQHNIKLPLQSLADVAPYILTYLSLPVPIAMQHADGKK